MHLNHIKYINIIRNILMINLLSFTLGAQEKKEMIIKINSRGVYKDSISVRMIFKTDARRNFYYDSNIFNVLEPADPQLADELGKDDFFELAEFSNILIENERGKFKFFSKEIDVVKIIPGSLDSLGRYEIEYELVQSYYSPSYTTIKSDSVVIIKSPIVNKKQILYCPRDKRVRFHYIFVPNNELLLKGYRREYYISNWINIDEITE